jgi:hypothetical protein
LGFESAAAGQGLAGADDESSDGPTRNCGQGAVDAACDYGPDESADWQSQEAGRPQQPSAGGGWSGLHMSVLLCSYFCTPYKLYDVQMVYAVQRKVKGGRK